MKISRQVKIVRESVYIYRHNMKWIRDDDDHTVKILISTLIYILKNGAIELLEYINRLFFFFFTNILQLQFIDIFN